MTINYSEATRNREAERRIETTYLVTDVEHALPGYADEPSYQPALVVSTSHDKDRKALVTTVSRIRTNGRIVRYAVEYNSDPIPYLSPYVGLPVARYSQKALVERHETILANVGAVLDANDKLMEWTVNARM